MKRPANFDDWNPALRGAFMKGARAQEAGDPESACPYRDRRTSRGAITWSRSFIIAWLDGWRAAQQAQGQGGEGHG